MANFHNIQDSNNPNTNLGHGFRGLLQSFGI